MPKSKPPRTPFEQATIFLSVGRYRRAAEILLQIIMEQEGRLREIEKRLPEREANFTDGLEQASDYCKWCKGPCKRNFCIYCGADFDKCECE